MDETREQYLERIINGSTAYINVKERREEKCWFVRIEK